VRLIYIDVEKILVTSPFLSDVKLWLLQPLVVAVAVAVAVPLQLPLLLELEST